LELINTKVSDEAVQKLRQTLPDVNVSRTHGQIAVK
jgi:hypothetical protein